MAQKMRRKSGPTPKSYYPSNQDLFGAPPAPMPSSAMASADPMAPMPEGNALYELIARRLLERQGK